MNPITDFDVVSPFRHTVAHIAALDCGCQAVRIRIQLAFKVSLSYLYRGIYAELLQT